MKKVKVGTKIKNSIGGILECVKIDGILYEFKYVLEDGTLSTGSVILLSSYFEYEIL
jgi:hypothetical protein